MVTAAEEKPSEKAKAGKKVVEVRVGLGENWDEAVQVGCDNPWLVCMMSMWLCDEGGGLLLCGSGCSGE